MLGLLAPTLLAVVIAAALGGSARRLVGSRIEWWTAALGAFAIELALYDPPINTQPWALAGGPWVWLATRMVLLAVLIRNAWPRQASVARPWLVAAGGLALNSLAIALNAGHMPQSHAAAVAVWGASHIDPSRLQNVVPMGPHTALPWLGDIFPEPAWLPRPNVISVGDVLLAVGLAWWAFEAMAPSIGSRSRIVGLIRVPLHGPARPTRRCST
jgi:hypothetical protein